MGGDQCQNYTGALKYLTMHFIFGYAIFIQVYTSHLGMQFLFRYTLHIWVCNFYSGIHFTFGYAIFIQVYTLHLGMQFLFGYTLHIWVCNFYSIIIIGESSELCHILHDFSENSSKVKQSINIQSKSLDCRKYTHCTYRPMPKSSQASSGLTWVVRSSNVVWSREMRRGSTETTESPGRLGRSPFQSIPHQV